MKTHLSVVLLACCALALAACGRTNVSPAEQCERVRCPEGTACDPEDGSCKAPGELDAGTEAGDAGTDADGGADCRQEAQLCGSNEYCDANTGECQAGCASDTQCPQSGGCDLTTHSCFSTDAGLADAGTEFDGGAVQDGGTIQDGGTTNDGGTSQDGGTGLPPCDATCAPPRVCDPAGNNGAGACVTCTAILGCTSPTPVCDTQVPGGRCVECAGNADCFGQTPVCDLSTNTCVGCLGNADCNSALPVCDTQAKVCVGCAADTDCGGTTPRCDLATTTCVSCLGNADCGGTTPICDPSAQTCGPCTSNASCGTGSYCAFDGSCQALPDTCAGALTVSFTPGSNTTGFVADTAMAQDDETGSCSTSGRELVYKLTLTTARDLAITAARATNSTANPVIYLRSSPCATGTQLACSNGGWAGAQEAINLQNVQPGDYYLFVESAGTTTGRINVTVTLNPPSIPPPNDACGSAQSLTFTGGVATATGTTVNATNDNPASATTPTCSTSARQTGRDVVYAFTLAQAQDVTVTASPTSAGFRPAVYVRGPSSSNTCASDTQLGCQSSNSVTPQVLRLSNLAAGTYFVWVDSVLDTSGTFNLQVALSAPTPNDTCQAPTALSFTNGQAQVTGDTRFAQNDNQGIDPSPTCSNSAKADGQDLVYSYTLTQPRDVTLTVTPTGTNPTYEPVVYVRAGGCTDTAASSELGCQADFTATPQTLTFTNQPAGTYYVWVDSAQQTAGPFLLDVTLAVPAPPPPNDACPGTALNFNGTTTATASGSTQSATNGNGANDAVPTCSNSAKSTGKDVVYSYTLSQARDVTVTVSPTTAGFFPGFYVKQGSCGSLAIADELACRAPNVSGPVSTLLLNQPAGTYWVWVDGLNSTSGTFDVSVTTTPPTPPPANDTCSGAQPLTFNATGVATATGDTSAAGNSNTASDAAPTCSPTAKQKGRDVVYSFTLAQTRDVTVDVQPTGAASTFQPVAYLRGAGASTCASISAGDEQLCVAAGTAGPVSGRQISLPAGQYFVWVDGANETWGPFQLRVTLSGPTPRPTNESCSAPATLTVGTPVAGDTTFANDEYSRGSLPPYSAACIGTSSQTFLGNDLVYQFTATAAQHTVLLQPAATFDAALFVLQPTCGPAACTAGSDRAGGGTTEWVTFATTPGNVYFVVVDGRTASSSGTFTLRVQ